MITMHLITDTADTYYMYILQDGERTIIFDHLEAQH